MGKKITGALIGVLVLLLVLTHVESAKTSKELEEVQQEVKDLDELLNTVYDENEDLEEELKDIEEELSKTKKTLDKTKKSKDELKEKNDAKDSKINKLEKDLSAKLERERKAKEHAELDKKEVKEQKTDVKGQKTEVASSDTVKENKAPQGKKIMVEATAYTDNSQSQGKWVGQTATGVKPQRGVIAVDPNVIPLGTKMYVEGYGEAVAGDTGGAIKGNKVDLFFDTQQEATQYGVRQVEVTILN